MGDQEHGRFPTCTNIMSLVRLAGLYSGCGMSVLTGMTCWVLSSFVMADGPRVRFIELHREQSEGREAVDSQRTQPRYCE